MRYIRILVLGLIFLIQSVAVAKDVGDVNFETRKIKIGKHELTVEIADTPKKQAQGLMFRDELKPGHGMLFIFDEERTLSFWMKNTFIPLSIGYFNKNKELIDMQDMTPEQRLSANSDIKTYPSKAPAMYALEVPAGWFREKKIRIGQKFDYLDLRPKN